MLEVSKTANPNYLAKIVRLSGLRKHENADRLQIATVDFQNVITGMEAQEGNVMVYFPVECKLNPKFVAHINGFRKSELNADNTKVGFFEENCRVKAIKLRGEKSMGFIVPIHDLVIFSGNSFGYVEDLIGKEFDTVNGIKLLEKYEIPVKESNSSNQSKKVKISRIIDGQVNLHVDTENLRKNAHKIKQNDLVSVSYKTHGTSWWVSNVPVKRVLAWYELLLLWLGFAINTVEYDYVYGSRKVVKNADLNPSNQGHYFGYDLWKDIMQEVKSKIPKNYTLYGECIGYDKNNKAIQKGYDYGCAAAEYKLQVYRITVTNADGVVTELSTPEIIEFCSRAGLDTVHYFHYCTAGELLEQNNIKVKDDRDFTEKFVKFLESKYNEQDCFMCENKVPAEGVVVRKEGLFSYEAYKLKCFNFLMQESKQLDSGESDIESEN
jgi:hypothetical protein